MLLSPHRSALVVVDVQERLAPAVAGAADVIRNARILLQAAERLGIPALVSEQYPKGLGRTVDEVAALVPPEAVFPKVHFSCGDEPHFRHGLAETGRDQVVICGMEAHVCVLQTALTLQAQEKSCAVVADAVGSRRTESRDLALARLRQAGVQVVSTEMVLFEWLQRAGTEEFRELSKLIK